MDYRRILAILLVALATVAQVQGSSESHADEEEPLPSPSVHDCRFHVEAALREYWTRRSAEPSLPQSKPTDQPQNLTEDPPPDSEEQSEGQPAPDALEGENDDDDDDEEEEAPEQAVGAESKDDEGADDEDEDDDEEEEESPTQDEASEETGDAEDVDDDDVTHEEQQAESEEEEADANAEEPQAEDDEDDDDDEAEDQPESKEIEESAEKEQAVEEDEDEDEETAAEDSDEDDEEEEEEQAEQEAAVTEEQEEQAEQEAAVAEEQEESEGEDQEERIDEEKSDSDGGEEAEAAEEGGEDDEGGGQESDEAADDDDDEGSPEEPASEESDVDLAEPSEESDLPDAGVEQELPSEQSEAEKPETADDSGEKEEEEEREAATDDEEKVEVVEEEETEEEKAARRKKGVRLRSRRHIDDILGLHDMGSESDNEEQQLINSILRELKRLYETAIRPLESTYKYRDISTRILGEAEVFAKPMVLFVGPWSSGKSTIINFLLGTEFTPQARKTGPELTDTDFTIISHGDKYQTVSGTEVAADWAFSGVQKFGQDFLDHVHGVRMPNKLLQKVTLVDTPGIIETRKQERTYPFNDGFQWFIDRADAIYVVFDPSKLEIGTELEAILDQLKGRESQVRFILNKADSIQQNEIMRVIGQLMWNLSPLMGSSEAPIIFAASLTAKPFLPRAPLEFLLDQEMSFLEDLKDTIDKRVENRIAYARRHAVRVRNHAKMVDCYLSTYYKHKSIFSNKKKVAEEITENPNQYSIYQGLSSLSNVSRYDLPDPEVYKDFFKLNPLYEFKPISSTCSYFRGCPLDKLDIAIAYELPELLGKYKKNTKTSFYVQEREEEETSR